MLSLAVSWTGGGGAADPVWVENLQRYVRYELQVPALLTKPFSRRFPAAAVEFSSDSIYRRVLALSHRIGPEDLPAGQPPSRPPAAAPPIRSPIRSPHERFSFGQSFQNNSQVSHKHERYLTNRPACLRVQQTGWTGLTRGRRIGRAGGSAKPARKVWGGRVRAKGGELRKQRELIQSLSQKFGLSLFSVYIFWVAAGWPDPSDQLGKPDRTLSHLIRSVSPTLCSYPASCWLLMSGTSEPVPHFMAVFVRLLPQYQRGKVWPSCFWLTRAFLQWGLMTGKPL